MTTPTPKQYQELQRQAKSFYERHPGQWNDTMNDLVIAIIEEWEGNMRWKNSKPSKEEAECRKIARENLSLKATISRIHKLSNIDKE